MSSSICKLVYAPLLLLLVPVLLKHQNVAGAAAVAVDDRIEPAKPSNDLSPSIPAVVQEETATYLVQYLYNHEEVLIRKMSDLKSEAPDGDWKASASCITSHAQAHKELEQALASLKQYDFFAAKKHVSDALQSCVQYHKSIDKGKGKGGFCKTVGSAIEVHEKLYDEAIGYLGTLHRHQLQN